jgi:hypothetical protein
MGNYRAAAELVGCGVALSSIHSVLVDKTLLKQTEASYLDPQREAALECVKHYITLPVSRPVYISVI